MEKVVIYHTNDMHSHLDYWPRLKQALKEGRARYQETETNFYAFDIGDAVDRYHPLIEASHGQAMIDLMNEADYDLVTVGNNEGVGEDKEELNRLYDRANFRVTIANLIDRETKQLPAWAEKFSILETKRGSKLGVFGLTFPFTISYQPLGWDVKDPFKIIEEILKTYSDQVDEFILLSHLGYSVDVEIAERFPRIKVIIGAHTHHVLERGEIVNGVLLAAAGKYSLYLGTIELMLEEGRIVSATAQVLDSKNDLKAYPGEKTLAQTYLDDGKKCLEEDLLGVLPRSLKHDPFAHTGLAQAGLDAAKDFSGEKVAILNAGLFLKDLNKGPVTYNDIHELLPHSMRLVKVTLPGDLMRVLMQNMQLAEEKYAGMRFSGVGFRGEYLGKICYDGVEFDPASQEVIWLGRKLVSEEVYSFVTVDFFYFSKFFPLIKEKAEIELLFPEFYRQVFSEYLRKSLD